MATADPSPGGGRFAPCVVCFCGIAPSQSWGAIRQMCLKWWPLRGSRDRFPSPVLPVGDAGGDKEGNSGVRGIPVSGEFRCPGNWCQGNSGVRGIPVSGEFRCQEFRCRGIPGRVDLGGCPPRSPTDPGLHITRHPVPHLMNSRPSRSVVVTWTWFRSQCTWMFPLTAHERHPLPSTGSLGLVSRFHGTMRCCDSLPPISLPFVSFAWRYHRCVRGSSPPASDAEPWINRELVGGISSRRARWKRQGLPSSRRNPCDHSPYSSDPGVTRQAEWTMS